LLPVNITHSAVDNLPPTYNAAGANIEPDSLYDYHLGYQGIHSTTEMMQTTIATLMMTMTLMMTLRMMRTAPRHLAESMQKDHTTVYRLTHSTSTHSQCNVFQAIPTQSEPQSSLQ
jgi:hypothetical protein